MLIPYSELFTAFQSILLSRGFSNEKASLSAKLFADASLDGVNSHGINRFPAHVKDIDDGIINPYAEPVLTGSNVTLERFNGNLGPGNLNAWFCMNRAIDLAYRYEIGCVALNNTNHWLRAGNYGWLAAGKGCLGICFTNTIPNMPPWGGKDPRIGNNPIVIAVPGDNEEHLVLDMATSQYAYGKLQLYEMEGKDLPYAGGFDIKGSLTTKPSEIIKSQRVLPIGLWKGSGLTMMLDLLAACLSGGNATRDIGQKGREYALSQVFIAFRPAFENAHDFMISKRNELVEFIKSSNLSEENSEILYPGERALTKRKRNLISGIPVNDNAWKTIRDLI